MLFNDMLVKEHIDPDGVLVIRHTPWERGLKKVLPWLAAQKPDVFNAFQQTQNALVEAEMLRAKHVASFIGLEKRKGSKENIAVFIGLYEVGNHRPLTYEQFWEVPAFQEISEPNINPAALPATCPSHSAAPSVAVSPSPWLSRGPAHQRSLRA